MPKKGYKQTKEHRKKISEVMMGNQINKGRRFSKEHLKKMSEVQKGNTHTLGKHWKLSEETKKKISIAQKGRKFSKQTRKKMSINNARYWKNKKMPIEMRRKISEGNKGKEISEKTRKKMSEAKKGEKSCFWKGGLTPKYRSDRRSLEYKLWRKSLFQKDNFTCQKCNQRGGKLHPHHINNFAEFSELRFAIDNGITLCEKCHQKFHKKYGKRNNTKEQLNNFLNENVYQ
jgi:hypothetical protein